MLSKCLISKQGVNHKVIRKEGENLQVQTCLFTADLTPLSAQNGIWANSIFILKKQGAKSQS
jgi:hypothetical protein